MALARRPTPNRTELVSEDQMAHVLANARASLTQLTMQSETLTVTRASLQSLLQRLCGGDAGARRLAQLRANPEFARRWRETLADIHTFNGEVTDLRALGHNFERVMRAQAHALRQMSAQREARQRSGGAPGTKVGGDDDDDGDDGDNDGNGDRDSNVDGAVNKSTASDHSTGTAKDEAAWERLEAQVHELQALSQGVLDSIKQQRTFSAELHGLGHGILYDDAANSSGGSNPLLAAPASSGSRGGDGDHGSGGHPQTAGGRDEVLEKLCPAVAFLRSGAPLSVLGGALRAMRRSVASVVCSCANWPRNQGQGQPSDARHPEPAAGQPHAAGGGGGGAEDQSEETAPLLEAPASREPRESRHAGR